MSRDFRIRQAGSTAVLIDCDDLDGALAVFATLTLARERGTLEVSEVVPAAQTVLVAGGEARDPQRFIPRLRELLRESAVTATGGAVGPEAVIAVNYAGEDLDDVARLTGMSPDQVVDRHTASTYTVAFTGFAPGFAYLSGGDPRLEVPRRATPRPRILPGSVGLAGRFSGVYPRESPGGWQIIGTTAHTMWDTDREQPAALVAGGTVRFVAEREHVIAAGDAAGSAPGKAPRVAASSPSLRVIDAGLQSLVEDEGRHGVAGMGVGESGAAVRSAFRHANRLVGNRPGAAVVELAHGGFAVEAIEPAVLAITGAERNGRITGPYGTRKVPHARPFRLSAGERLTLAAPSRGLRSILGIRGGIDAPAVLGSRSRDTLASLGPEPLAAGDELATGSESLGVVGAPEPVPDARPLPAPGDDVVLRVVLGPRDDWFSAEALASFTGQLFSGAAAPWGERVRLGDARLSHQSWEVTPRSDRVGVRLAGAALQRAVEYAGRELPSEGMVLGAIQVPPDGQPVLFLADRPLTGGYPVIAVVHDDDIDLAAQLSPGCRVRFVAMSDVAPASKPRGAEPMSTEPTGTDKTTEQENDS
ncbi:carboxyltransferase domain-containing protein [Microbacterium sp.]|uniref:5-oxoprolinase subunit B/C family protein n=1 Tax=Microbacterium sp. TaxID=51671 RepID=UPI003C75C7D5